VPREGRAEIQGERLLFFVIDVYEVAGGRGGRARADQHREADLLLALSGVLPPEQAAAKLRARSQRRAKIT
jgi:hypothetical protein